MLGPNSNSLLKPIICLINYTRLYQNLTPYDNLNKNENKINDKCIKRFNYN